MKKLEGEKYSTVGWVPSMISFLRKRLDDAERQFPSTNEGDADSSGEESQNDSDNDQEQLIHDFLPDLVKKMKKDFEARFGNGDARQFDGSIIRGYMNRQIGIHPTIVISSVLDPRFKSLSCFWIQEDKDSIWDTLLDEMVILAKHKGMFTGVEEEQNEGRENENHFGNGNDELDLFLNDLENDHRDDAIVNDPANNVREVNQDQGTDGIRRQCKEELDQYKRLQSLGRYNNETNSFSCPLKDFWKKNEDKFPVLYNLAKKHLCVQATSAPSERVFSIASRIITKQRNRLHPDIAGSLMFVNSMLDWYNLKNTHDV